MTQTEMRAWASNAHCLAAAAAQIDTAVDAFDDVMNTVNRDVETVAETWRGEAASAAQASTESQRQVGNRLGIALIDIVDDLNRLGPPFVRACDTAVRVADSIRALGYVIADDGTVAPPATSHGAYPRDVPADLADGEAAVAAARNATTHQRDLARALAELVVADDDLAGRIRASVDALPRASERATTPVTVCPEVARILAGNGTLPPDPSALKRFWDGLTAVEKAELWNRDRSIGNRDGIPAADRDHFNRRHLAELQRDQRAAIARYAATHPHIVDGRVRRAPGPGGYVTDTTRQNEYDAATSMSRSLDALEDVMRNSTRARPRYLLHLDAAGRVAVAVHNPDTADNVATLVPGTGAQVSAVAGGVTRAEAMVDASEKADPRASTSVIAWYAYDAPRDLVAASGPASAAHAAGRLDEFASGLRATHEGGEDAHTTVLGHSYGTVVVGEAASEGRTLDADDLVFIASPGVGGPASTAELSLTDIAPEAMGDHVYATTAANDPIRLADGVHGASPVGRGFGARVFTSDPGTPLTGAAHSQYWDVRADGTGCRSLTALGLIIVGRGDTVR